MHTERLELMPGVWLNFAQTDRFKTGCFSFNLLRPLAEADAAPNALLPSVLLRGCRLCPDMQAISQRLDTLYGASIGTLIRKKGEVQTVGLFADFLEDRYAESEPVFLQMVQLLGSLLFEPCMEQGGFVREFLEGERLNLANTLDARMNDMRSYATAQMLKAMCRDEAYATARLGEKYTLEGLNGETMYRRWQDMLASSQVELFYMGQQTKEAVTDGLLGILESMPRARELAEVKTEVVCHDRPVQYVQEEMDVTQGKLALGLRTEITASDPRYPALMVLNAVFGAGMTSKLFVKIREEQSLCYFANSGLDKFKGVMSVSSGIEFDKYQIALDGILHQLELCKQGQITEQELESARGYLISASRTGRDNPVRLDDYAIGQAIAGLDGTMDDLAVKLQSVTMQQVVEAANTLRLDTVYFLKGAEA